MTNKLVVIINNLKVPKIKKILLYEMKFLVRNYSCLQNPWLGGYHPQIPVLSALCPQLNLLNPPPPEQNSWLHHWEEYVLGHAVHLLQSRYKCDKVTLQCSFCKISVFSVYVTRFGVIVKLCNRIIILPKGTEWTSWNSVVNIFATRWDIKIFYFLPTQCSYALYGSQHKQRLFSYTALTDLFL